MDGRRSRRPGRPPANQSGSSPSIPCSCCTHRVPPANQRCAALHRRLPVACCTDHQVDLRPEGRRRVLVHGRHRLGDGSHLHHLRPAWRWAAPKSCFEGVPTYPDAGRFWKMIQDHKCSIFYTAPTAIRSLIKAAEANDAVHPKSYDLSSLRLLGSVGEPINPPPGSGITNMSVAARCPIVDTFWQTETGGHMITPLPGATPMVPARARCRSPASRRRSWTKPARTCPTARAVFWCVKKPMAFHDPHHLG
jgi:hypothetical protein